MLSAAIWWAVLLLVVDERCPARAFWTIVLVPIVAGLLLASIGVIARGFKQEK
jgi:hypothetical protein